MVRLSLIESKAGVRFPDKATLFAQLDLLASPVAYETDPLRIIAPAVYCLHTSAKRLLKMLAMRAPRGKTLRLEVVNNFDTLTDMYTILRGISPPRDPVEKMLYEKELAFSRRMVEIAYDLLKELPDEGDESLRKPLIPRDTRERFASEIADAMAQNPLPSFALRSSTSQMDAASLVILIIFILFLLAYMGFFRFIFGVFRSP